MSKKFNSMLENAIVGMAIAELLDNGYQVEAEYRNGYFWVYAWDDETRPLQYKNWVQFVQGNGADCITDYTVSLDHILKPVNEFAKNWQD